MENLRCGMSIEQWTRAHWIWILRDQVGLESRQTVVRGTIFVLEQKKWNNACRTKIPICLIKLNKDEKNDAESYPTLTIESSISSSNHAMNPRCGSQGRKRRVPSVYKAKIPLEPRYSRSEAKTGIVLSKESWLPSPSIQTKQVKCRDWNLFPKA